MGRLLMPLKDCCLLTVNYYLMELPDKTFEF